MIKKNILLYLLIVGCSNVVSLHGVFPEWFTNFLPEPTLDSSLKTTISVVNLLQLSPFIKKLFADEATLLRFEAEKIQIHYHITQLLTNLRQVMTNQYYKDLSVYDQLVSYHLSLSNAQVSRNTLMIR